MIEEFRQAMRYNKSRRRQFSQAEMDRYYIRAIYNMTGTLEAMTPERIRGFTIGCIRAGSQELAIIEHSFIDSGKGNPLRNVSVMVFRDRYVFGLFAMADGIESYFHDGLWDECVLNLLN